MNDKKHNQLLNNRAEIKDLHKQECNNCEEQLIFALRTNEGQLFSIGINAILECLSSAIQKNEIPKLPLSWLREVEDGLGFDFDLGICYNDTCSRCQEIFIKCSCKIKRSVTSEVC